METRAILDKWRHLIEPTLNESLTPVEWEEFVQMPLIVFEGNETVIVAQRSFLMGGKTWGVIVAAGKQEEIKPLEQQMIEAAREDGAKALVYIGRRGWVRAMDYREAAVVGVKEI